MKKLLSIVVSTLFAFMITPQVFADAENELYGAYIHQWVSPQKPIYNIYFEQAVYPKSVERHVYFKSKNKRYKIKIEKAKRSYFYISPVRQLPKASEVELIVEPGILSKDAAQPNKQSKVITSFYTYPDFKFLGLICESNSGDKLNFTQNNETRLCNPIDFFELRFSAPIDPKTVQNAITSSPKIGNSDTWKNIYINSSASTNNDSDSRYHISLPFGLKAKTSYSIDIDKNKIRDIFGRKLTTTFPVSFTTDERLPNYHLQNKISVLEKDEDTQLPIVITNLEQISLHYDKYTKSGYAKDQTASEAGYTVRDLAYPFPLKIREYLSGESGIISASITTKPEVLSKNTGKVKETRLFSQVTPFSIHTKIGYNNTLVWVTTFKDGLPVANANVSVITGNLYKIQDQYTSLASAITDENGIAILPGSKELDPKQSLQGWSESESLLMLKVENEKDIAILPFSYNFEAYSNKAYPWNRQQYGHIHAWGFTPQGIYKAGEVVDFKIYVRDQDNTTLIPAPKEKYTLQVTNPLGQIVYEEKNFSLSDFGSYSGKFQTAKNSSVGWYYFRLYANFTSATWSPLKVLISDFTPSPFKVTTRVNTSDIKEDQNVEVYTTAKLHSGGAYTQANTKVTARLVYAEPKFKEEFLQPFSFLEYDMDSFDKEVFQASDHLNNQGELVTTFKIADKKIPYAKVLVESGVQDDRGKSVSNLTQSAYWGRKALVGIFQKEWYLKAGQAATLQTVVVDDNKQVLANVPVKINIYYKEVKVAKAKSAGSAYLPKYTSKWILESSFDEVSSSSPINTEFTLKNGGTYKLEAVINDIDGREHKSSIIKWSDGSNFILWEEEAGDTLDITAESKEYKIGETARFFIKNPFQTAYALFTIERYGIQKHWTQKIEGNSTIIEFPITEEQLPGFYFSAIFFSPRVDKPIDEFQVDLGKPSFRIGYAQITVKDTTKELLVNIKSDKETYKPREAVNVSLSAAINNAAQNESIEYAVAILDEGVFDLLKDGKANFDPYKGMYDLDGLDVTNYNLIKALIGRQKFEKKMANAGGDGAADINMRTLLKYVAYWNPSIITDNEGKASFEFLLPDNITGWRIFAIATSKDDLMGLGDANIKVSQPIEIRAALPNQILVNDSFNAEYVITNHTDKDKTVNVNLTAEAEGLSETTSETIILTANEKKSVRISLKPSNIGELKITATAKDEIDSDGIISNLNVLNNKAEMISISSAQVKNKENVNIVLPENIDGDTAKLDVVISPSILPDLSLAFDYMKQYPYSCWEQKVSRAAAAWYYGKLKDNTTYEWKDAEGFIQKVIDEMPNYQASNGGMTYYVPKDEYVSPYLTIYTAQILNKLKADGYKIIDSSIDNLNNYILDLLRKDSFVNSQNYTKEDIESLRINAVYALLPSGKVTLDDLMRQKAALEYSSVFAQAQYLIALKQLNGTKAQIDEVIKFLMTRAEVSSNQFYLKEREQLSWAFLNSDVKSNCMGLAALIENNSSDSNILKSLTYLNTKYIISNGYNNTQEIVYCLEAFNSYKDKNLKEGGASSTTINLNGANLGSASFTALTDRPITIESSVSIDKEKQNTLIFETKGKVMPFYTTKLNYSVKNPTDLVNKGLIIRREFSVLKDNKWQLIKDSKVQKGDLVKVDLYVSLNKERNFVVVSDPVAGGLEPINKELATSSYGDLGKMNQFADDSYWHSKKWIEITDGWNFYYQELTNKNVNFYSEQLEAGNYHLTYVAQAVASGSFTAKPAKAELMYDNSIYGMCVPQQIEIN